MDPGQIIAQRYRLDRKLGEGGMGTVYRAEHVITGRRVAVKVMEGRDKLPPESLDRFLREARAPAAIGHPNIVEVIDAGTEPDGTPFIAMELLEGETLDEVIKRDRVVQPAQLGEVMDQLLDGLDAMHARGFVHRDLKPANIFLATGTNGSLRVKLLDFGIAKALGEEGRTRSGYVIGTPAYMAPEQMRNARSATARSDLWSVGVMLFEALAGYRPFRGETFGLLAQISGPEAPTSLASIAPYLPSALVDLVDRLLSKDVSLRPVSASAVRAELASLWAECPPVRPLEPPDDAASESFVQAPTQQSASAAPSDASWRDGPLANEVAPSAPSVRPAMGSAPSDVGVRFAIAVLVLAAAAASGFVVIRGRHSSSGQLPSGGAAQLAQGSDAPMQSNAELRDFLRRWLGTVVGSQGRASVANYYAEQTRFHSNGGVSPVSSVQRQWADIFDDGGSFGIDWDRTRWSEESADLGNGVSTACINLPGATGRVIKVRAWATEMMQDRSAAIGCRRLEGVYLIRLRRVAGQLRICHESWSLHDGICASCPTAPVCQDGGSGRI